MCAISPTVKQAQESKVNFLANNFSNMPCLTPFSSLVEQLIFFTYSTTPLSRTLKGPKKSV